MPQISFRRIAAAVGAVVFLGASATIAVVVAQRLRDPQREQRERLREAEQTRRLLFEELQPVKLTNCEFTRFGESHDGGYLLCGNLLGGVRSAYSYGIAGYDQWGCDVSTRLGVPVHQYDCFDLTRPACAAGRTVFREECIAAARRTEEGRIFDTLAAQVGRNDDGGKRLLVKIDVEGAEWEALLAAPDELLRSIDQLVVEFHGTDDPRYLALLARLKTHFSLANLHWNNNACRWGKPPFPSLVYEALFVNRRLAVVDPAGKVALPNPLDQPNRRDTPDCQGPPALADAGTAPAPDGSR